MDIALIVNVCFVAALSLITLAAIMLINNPLMDRLEGSQV